ncbi:hypothetical protein RFI_12835, partial [Reticulomyxa filosa]
MQIKIVFFVLKLGKKSQGLLSSCAVIQKNLKEKKIKISVKYMYMRWFMLNIPLWLFVLSQLACYSRGATTGNSSLSEELPLEEKLALVKLYNSTNGPGWTHQWAINWTNVTSSDFCSFWGVTCGRPIAARRAAHVVGMELLNNSLHGTIDKSIGNFTQIQILIFEYANLYGTIPKEIGLLRMLGDFWIVSTNISGTIPIEIGRLTLLQFLYLQESHLTGTIPSELGLPKKKKKKKKKKNLYMHICTIPSELSRLSQLRQLALDGNALSGTLPPEFGYSNPSLYWISATENQLEGSIPESYGNLKSLTTFDLAMNRLSGSIPSSMFQNCTRMTTFMASFNSLTGTISSFISHWRFLVVLFLGSNRLHGTIPVELAQLSLLVEVDLSDNFFNGTIPPQFGFERIYIHMYICIYIYVYVHFEHAPTCTLGEVICKEESARGEISSLMQDEAVHATVFIFYFFVLTMLSLQENALTGSIPAELGNLSSLVSLLLRENELSGTMSEYLGKYWKVMEGLDVSSNQLTGTVPTWIWTNGQNMMRVLNLANNSFEGTLDKELEQWTALISLDVSHNQFMGTLPSFANSRTLAQLSVSNNQLHGSFPLFTNNSQLALLSLDNNHFSASLPVFPTQMRNLISLTLHNNKLVDHHLHSWLDHLFACAPRLNILTLFNNHHLVGTIPSSLYRPPLQAFISHNCGIYGELPSVPSSSSLHDLNNNSLQFVSLSQNYLSGTLPKRWISTSSSSSNSNHTEWFHFSFQQNTARLNVSASFLIFIYIYIY